MVPNREQLSAEGWREEDFEERFVRSSGRGGQNVNKVSTAVWILHRPTGMGVKAMEHRTQAQNRAAAWARLLRLLAARKAAAVARSRAETEQERRRKRVRPAAVRRAFVQEKRRGAQRRADRRAGET